MKESIIKFAEQFEFQPEIQNKEKLEKDNYQSFILGGMGGSHLSGGLLHILRPGINLHLHKDYGLPAHDDEFMAKSLFIASSYSGNTEETLDFADAAYSKGYEVVIITSGGKLLEFAQKNELPHVVIPSTGIQPRCALGYSVLAVSAFVEPQLIPELQNLSETLDPESLENQGKEIAKKLENRIPIIYSSNLNEPLSYIWKITMNETAKIPSFNNTFPELNHNEMQSFNTPQKFSFIILHDSEDQPKIELRMQTVEALYEEKGLEVTSIFLEGDSVPEKIFKSILLANWTAIEIAEEKGVDPEAVPLIEEFKKRIK